MPNIPNDETKIFLQVAHPDEEEDTIDLVNVAHNIGKKKKLYGYLLLLAAFVGLVVGLVITGVQHLSGSSAYARAVVTFQYEGIEDGLDPNGASFDINKLKAPAIIQAAFDELGVTDDEVTVDAVRQSISIEGVIPSDAVERISVINQMAEDNSSYYEKILDVSYYPSQYVVYLNKIKGVSGTRTTEILNAVLAAYKDWFLKTYANTAALTVTGNLVNYEDYDYVEAEQLIASQIEIMQNYVNERYNEAPDFRSSTTGLSFGDIKTSLETIKSVDLANLQSYIENNNLTKDKAKLIDYYNYNISEYNLQLSQLQAQLSDVQSTIDGYQKDPVVIVSNQDTTQQIEQTNEYYDKLVAQKLELTDQIAEMNTKLSKTNALVAQLQSTSDVTLDTEEAKANEMLSSIVATLTEWTTRIEETTQEYYDTTLFSNAYKISVPAQYQSGSGKSGLIKTVGICIGVALLVVVLVWCLDGLFTEMRNGRREKQGLAAVNEPKQV